MLLHVDLVHQLAQDDERRVAADAAAVQRQDAHFPARLVRRRRRLVGRLLVVVVGVVGVGLVVVVVVVRRLVVGLGLVVVGDVVVGLDRVPFAAIQLSRALRFLD